MKKLVSMAIVALLCLTMVCPAFAASANFVPSVSYKDEPDSVVATVIDGNGNNVADVTPECLDITPLSEGDDDLKKLYEDLLKNADDLYEKLGIAPGNSVIRDLFDLNLLCADIKALIEGDKDLKITFDMGVGSDDRIHAGVYVDGEWVPAKSVVNNGDGTVTFVFSDLGSVALVVEKAGTSSDVETGDNANLVIWIAVMIAAAVALVVLITSRRKLMH